LRRNLYLLVFALTHAAVEGSQREGTALLSLLVPGVARTSARLTLELIVTAAGTAMTRVALI